MTQIIKTATRPLLFWNIIEGTTKLYVNALGVLERYQLSLWDSLIVAAANLSGAKQLLSEDLNDGQLYGNIAVVNPFIRGGKWSDRVLSLSRLQQLLQVLIAKGLPKIKNMEALAILYVLIKSVSFYFGKFGGQRKALACVTAKAIPLLCTIINSIEFCF